jgi:hypothetical protein
MNTGLRLEVSIIEKQEIVNNSAFLIESGNGSRLRRKKIDRPNPSGLFVVIKLFTLVVPSEKGGC